MSLDQDRPLDDGPRPPGGNPGLSSAGAAIAADLASFRPDMLRFALLHLREVAMAEDAVQEATLAALQGAERFAGRASLKTWVFSILRNKIIDLIRQRVREPVFEEPEEEIGEAEFDELYAGNGHWLDERRPSDWGDPERALENKRFWLVFEACLEHLPAASARVFMMRELLGLSTAEICAELSMTSSNCWVVLHRARMALRLCLDRQWFAGGRDE
ncbi:sigma-70 family RNA polymerase sigma factor [Accumulibacter sp.]|uniref:sigma-70 family RNA polymerase sigma factor n=1 Tax=Accumulibacter sp. TaxID=2053492 RepID=UPI0025D0E153|nr:sigma-70 family RNA polymerase sigma factor [Accumulibacter sp.]MCM8596683.1 sigma-70 family RNA polymerase sigma factor [Accumulibacter sp.]MCM8627649.1 sigma-70 family RNA polymerase sigma factor [Accumulibacter sp.]MDS4050831.1 sigma-70 family RNA polymerase sigma factor [Accumulibacter sp.]